ncbi:type II toxin-antitoxin system VapC family toxin [Nitriliruptor alkaliphilus]|uniref:type II toxin-antitoxin system VapC family toxin n=1 Tax=Nitriliruptor alkaliphilus TaxID=427918 RepID=UPI000696CB25|nr:type II toxin-antitoxin system VapC family toxin [Nitriliruptor alkaliphilus]
MIAYFDTSALIPLLVDEPGSDRAARLWDVADNVVAVRLIYAEARAALAQATRMGRLAAADLTTAIEGLEGLYVSLDLLEVDERIVRRAGELAQHHALRGYDAVHLAAAERVRDDATVLVAGDRSLCAAAGALGMAVADTSVDGHDG